MMSSVRPSVVSSRAMPPVPANPYDVDWLPDRMDIVINKSRYTVAGVRVGVLFVRPAVLGEFANTPDGAVDVTGMWLLDLPDAQPARSMVAGVYEFWNAITLADEVSRYAACGVEAFNRVKPTAASFRRVLGRPLFAWLLHAIHTDAVGNRVGGYRAWCDAQGMEPPSPAQWAAP